MSDPSIPSPYVFDQSQHDHDRLVFLYHLTNESTRETCIRAGLRPGDRAIDVGCGPVGALPVLAELVGSAGSVVGLDMNPGALAQARRLLDSLNLRDVELVTGDITTLSPEVVNVHGLFDLAFCRLVLMYQRDPAATLRQVATLVRPGGRIVVTDLLHDPHYPYFDPPVPATERILRLFFALVERKGGTVDVAQHYRQICEQSGLRLVAQRGVFLVAQDPRDYLTYFRDVILTIRENLLTEHMATPGEIDGLVQELDAAQATVQFGGMTLCVEMIAAVP